jgi:hypothetical protein
MNAFSFYHDEKLREVMISKELSYTEASFVLWEMWDDCELKDKAPYIKMHDDDKMRYDVQMAEFKKKGYFMISDGVRSTDFGVSSAKQKVSSIDTSTRPIKRRTDVHFGAK